MRSSTALSRGWKTVSILRHGLPVVAAALMLAPVAGTGQDSSSSAPPASSAEAPASAASGEGDAAVTIPPGTVMSYTEEQAARGKTAYTDDCSVCHGTTLGGGGETPALAGKGFRERWFVGSPEPFFSFISSNMPQGDPGSLTPETYADITAYLMSRNRVPAGDAEFPADPAAIANIVLPPLTN